MIHDIAGARLFLTGGFGAEAASDTWGYDAAGWRQLAEQASPGAVARGALATAPDGNGVTLFHGASTWTLRGESWQRAPGTGPEARERHAMARDATRARVVLFGGYADNTPLGDTWEFDGNAWHRATPTQSPPARLDHAMAYDATRRRTVLFGGGVFGTYFNDTWEWDGAVWQQRFPTRSPSPRALHGLIYDAARGETVLFGGSVGTGGNFETWTYSGTDWQQRNPRTTPNVAYGFATMVYDAARERVVLWGDDGDVWEWDGSDWLRRTTQAGLQKLLPTLAYDPMRAATFTIGSVGGQVGDGDTYRYAPIDPATSRSYGQSCGPLPRAFLVADRLPWIGDFASLRAQDLAASASVVAFLLGASDRTWNGLSLPLDLTGIGMSRCDLRVSPDVSVPQSASAGRARLALALPPLRNLIGAALFVQTLSPAPGANVLGLVTSDAVAMTIGSR